jgi:hypothetical protein
VVFGRFGKTKTCEIGKIRSFEQEKAGKNLLTEFQIA